MTSSNSTTTDWHMYFHGVDREDFPDYPDDHFGPKAGYAYQHDATNDEYHSILSNPAAVSLLEQVKAGKTLDPARLLHFTDAHLPVLAELLQHNWLASKDDDAKEVMACVAYRLTSMSWAQPTKTSSRSLRTQTRLTTTLIS